MIDITVIIKTKNSENSICSLLESIKDFNEVFIVDENSSDDTVEIAKTYKTKIIYSTKFYLDTNLNQALKEASNEWVLFLEDDEIVPNNLIEFLKKYSSKPKKNRYAIKLSRRVFYLNKEIKALNNKELLRFFKKENCVFKDFKPCLLNTKTISHNKNFKLYNEYILKYIKKDIYSSSMDMLEDIRFELKGINKKPNLLNPLKTFFNQYFKVCMNGKKGLICAYKKAFRSFIYETMLFEREEEDDI